MASGEFGAALAVRDDDGQAAAAHAGKKEGGRFRQLDHDQPRLELLAAIALEGGPVFRAGDDVGKLAHHLAAVAHAQREAVGACEEGRKFLAQAAVEEDGFRPALPGTEHVAIREPAAGSEALEVGQMDASGLQVAHVDVEGVKPGARKGSGHFDMAIDALFAQDGDFRCGPFGNKRGGGREGEAGRQARVGHIEQGVEFFLRAGRVVAQTGDLVAGFRPDALQFGTRLAKGHFGVTPDADFVMLIERADEVGDAAQARFTQNRHDLLALLAADLHDSSEFFVEQGRQNAVEQTAIDHIRLALHAVDVVHQRVVAQPVEVQGDADVAREGHFADRGEQATVGAVVVGQQQVFRSQFPDGVEKSPQAFHFGIRHFIACRAMDLRQRGAAEAVLPCAQVDQKQLGFCFRQRLELRREGAASVGAGREGRHDERERRDDLFFLPVCLPARFHRKRILAHRDGQVELTAKIEGHGLYGVKQGRIFSRVPGGCHPVGRELDVSQRADIRRRQIGDRLAHGHAARSRAVEQGQRRALTHGKRFALQGIKAHRGHSAVSHGNLPGPDHLVTRRHAAHTAVANGDEELLGSHRRQTQHTQGGLCDIEAVEIEPGGLYGLPPDIAQHTGRLAQQHVHGHVDGVVAEVFVMHCQMAVAGRPAQRGEGAAFPFAQGGKFIETLRRDGQHIAFLRLVRPDFARRHARFLGGHGAKLEARPAACVVGQFRQGVGDAARADVVNGQNRIFLAHLPAAVDDFLRAPLDFRVAALHRGEIEIGGVRAGRHRRGRAAAQPDQHAGAAELDQDGTGRKPFLESIARRDIAQPTGNHDGLVITPHLAVEFLLISPEIAGEIGPAKFIVKGRSTYGPFDHDVQRGGNALGLAVRQFPGLFKAGDAEVGHGKAAQARLGSGAAPRRAFVADFAARTGCRAGKRRNCRRMVVRFDLGEDVRQFVVVTVSAVAIGIETPDLRAFDHGGVIRIGHHRAFRVRLVGFANHAKEGIVFRLAVDHPGGIENLVAAVFGIGLGEHHEFDIGWVAAQPGEIFREIVDFVIRECQPQFAIGPHQCGASLFQQGNGGERLGRKLVEEGFGGVRARENGFRHAVMQPGGEGCQRIRRARLEPGVISRATLDATDTRKAALTGNVGRLARPGRNRPQTRGDQQHRPRSLRLALFPAGQAQQLPEANELIRFKPCPGFQFNEIPVFGHQRLQPRQGSAHLLGQTRQTGCRKGSIAAQFEDFSHGRKRKKGKTGNYTCHALHPTPAADQ